MTHDLTRRLVDLTPEQRTQIERELVTQAPSKTGSEAIPRRQVSGPVPLSFAQQRLWFLDRLHPDSAFYNVRLAIRLSGALDVTALRRALTEIVQRHEALRTTFRVIDGDPMQVIAPSLELAVPVTDLGEWPAAEIEAEAHRLAREEGERPFDLERGPLFRARLLRLAKREHALLVTLHHIVSDGWSMGVLARELAALYTAFAQGRSSPLPPLPVQYADYAVWQRAWLRGDTLQAQLSHWKQQLEGAPALLTIPTDRLRPAVQSYGGAHQSRTLPQALADRLRALGRSEGATLFMTLLAAYQALLARYAGQDDIVVGSPIAGRTRLETEGLIGFFANTLALRTDLSGDPTVRELLGRVREVALQSYDHQELPFERLVEELHPERSLSHAPLVHVIFSFRRGTRPSLQLPGLTLRRMVVDRRTAKFDLGLSVSEATDGLVCEMEYSTDLFDGETIGRMLRHFQSLLEGMVADPGRRLSTLPLLSPAERRQLVVGWNDTESDYPKDRCIHELFEAEASRTPDAPAVSFEGDQLTYGALDRRANQLAHHLRRLGVGPEVPVGIALERSSELVVGLLGILKAGGAYVPLDLRYPPDRLRFLLADAGARVLVTEASLAATLAPREVQVVCLDRDRAQIATQSAEPLLNRGTARNLAYVMYTSGSTGAPKGVAVEHRAVVRLVQGARYARFTAGEVFLQLAPLTFDASTFELWGALLHGARLVVAPAELPSLVELGRLLRLERVTTLWLTAELFHQMVDEQLEDLRGLRQLLAGGDVLSVAHVERMRQALPSCCLINGYGPTENTTFTTCHTVGPGDCSTGSVPIGRPIANTRVYVLDERLQPVPIGVRGELYTGGDGVARGYLGRADLTAERFIPDPFSGYPGTRLYRTGDLVRWRGDGNLEFLGRSDHQVKLRGYRIEPGEIEAVLARHPAVGRAVVLLRQDDPRDPHLVAYVVAQQAGGLRDGELQEFLRQRLPDYMIPSAIVLLDAIPVTPAGKVDRLALPEPSCARVEVGSYVAPRNSVEVMLAEIWADLLQVERVGVHDNFFALGGHSLKATQVISHLRARLGVELPLRALFEAPTVAGLAALVEAPRPASLSAGAPPLVPLARAAYRGT